MRNLHSPAWLGKTDTLAKHLGKSLSKKFSFRITEQEPVKRVLLDSIDNALWDQQTVLLASRTKAQLYSPERPIRALPLLSNAPGVPEQLFGQSLPSELKDLSDIRALLKRFEYQHQDAQWDMLDDEGKTVARLYLTSFVSETSGTHASLVSAQPVRGYDKAFRALSKALQQSHDLKATEFALPKLLAQIGYIPLPYSNKPTVQIDPSEPSRMVARDLCLTMLDVARVNEPWIEKDIDTEFLHDYRVSLRKVRSVISLFKGVFPEQDTQQLKQGFAALMNRTGRLRDLDVYLLDRDHYFELLPENLHPGLEVMFSDFAKEREQALQAITKWLKSDAYHQELDQLCQYLTSEQHPDSDNASRPALQLGSASIWKRYRKVCKIAMQIDDSTPDEQVHELRIQCKKLRYLMEFFAPLFPAKEIKRLIKALKRLQDNLGRFNDFSVQQESLHHYLKGKPRNATTIKLAESIGALTLVLANKQKQERAKVVENFQRFHSDSVHLSFMQLFKDNI